MKKFIGIIFMLVCGIYMISIGVLHIFNKISFSNNFYGLLCIAYGLIGLATSYANYKTSINNKI